MIVLLVMQIITAERVCPKVLTIIEGERHQLCHNLSVQLLHQPDLPCS